MTTTAMRFFNTAGPIVAADHYHVPPLERLDRDEVLMLIRQQKYFVLHAPRQTGKTSALLALRDLLNSGGAGEYRWRLRQRRGGPGGARRCRNGDAGDPQRARPCGASDPR